MPKAFITGLLLVFSVTVNSFAATFSEGTGDYSNSKSPPTVLSASLTLGTNTVSGHVDYTTGDYHDAFQITLPPGTEISLIEWQATDITRGNPSYRKAYGFTSFNASGTDPVGVNSFSESTGATSDYKNSDMSYPWPVFNLDHTIFASNAGASQSINGELGLYPETEGTSIFDWTYTFTVVESEPAPTPTSPATVPVFNGWWIALGLFAGLGLLRRRSK